MKIRRYKKFKKNINFYQTNFGFRKPYQVLVDPTFAHAALMGQVCLAEQLPKHFGEEVVLVVSKCVLEESKNLGPQLNGTHKMLSQFKVWNCNHQPICTAADCIDLLIGTTNSHHFILASQDRSLKKQVSDRHVPFLHITHQTIQFEAPSQASREHVQANLDRKLERTQNQVTSQNRGRFRKRNPNPLSVLKSKKSVRVQKNRKRNDKKIISKMLDKIESLSIS